MVTQQAVALYVVLDGIERPVRPKVDRLGQSKFDNRRYTQIPENGEVDLDDSRIANRTAYELRQARSDRYDSLARSQPLVRANKVSVDDMREALGNFDDDFGRYVVWAELTDSQPQLRGFELSKGMNAFLYRGLWTVKEDYDIDVSAMDPEKDLVAVTVPINYGQMNQSWKDATGVTGTFEAANHYPANLDFAEKNLKGLNALRWGFRYRGGPYLYSYGWPDVRVSDRGALSGSRLSVDEIVERFVKSEPQRPQRSAYELELDGLERQLSDLRSGYNDRTVQEMEQRLANLRKLGSQ